MAQNNKTNILEKDEEDEKEIDVIDRLELSHLFSLRKDTELYVVSMDNVYQFYTKDMDKAREYMRQMARTRALSYSGDYTCYLRETEIPDCIEIVGLYKFYVIAYEHILHRLEIHSVRELEELLEPEELSHTRAQPKSGFLKSIFDFIKID